MELFQRDELRTFPPSASASRTYTFAPMRLFGQISVSVFKSMATEGTEVGARAVFTKVGASRPSPSGSNFALDNVTGGEAVRSRLLGNPEHPPALALLAFPRRCKQPENRIRRQQQPASAGIGATR